MNTQHFGPEREENENLLRERLRHLTPHQLEDLVIWLTERHYKAATTAQELSQTVRLLNRQYERALGQISALESQLKQNQCTY